MRVALIHDISAAHQGVEDDDMNLLCLGGRVVGYSLAWELIQSFLGLVSGERNVTGNA